MPGADAELLHPWKNITTGSATLRKSGIFDMFPAVKTGGLSLFELRQTKIQLRYLENVRNRLLRQVQQKTREPSECPSKPSVDQHKYATKTQAIHNL
jgi:hypothetical protein